MTEAGADPVPWLPPFEGPRAPAMPAIRPSTAPVGRSTATFTAQDVEEYFRVHGLSGSVRIQAAGPITVEKVDFLSGSEVAARLNRGINQPDDVLLCLATLRGSFGVEGPSEALAYNSSTACVLFDAQTGNTLVFGLGQ